MKQLPSTQTWTGAVRVNDDDRAEAERDDVVSSIVTPELVVPRWDLQEHSSTGSLLWVTNNLNANPMPLSQGYNRWTSKEVGLTLGAIRERSWCKTGGQKVSGMKKLMANSISSLVAHPGCVL